MINNQKGIAHIFVLLLLLVGLGTGLYLVQNPTVFNPKALDTGRDSCTSTLATMVTSDPCLTTGTGRVQGASGFRNIEFYCNTAGTGQKMVAGDECRTESDWRTYATTACSNICVDPNYNLVGVNPPPPPGASTTDSCNLSLKDGDTVSGSPQVAISGARSNPNYYLALWLDSDKQGGYHFAGSTQTDNLNGTFDSRALFSNGPATVECRIQKTKDGDGAGTDAVFTKKVIVNVANTAVAVTQSPYSCTIGGPSVVAPGQLVSFPITLSSNTPVTPDVYFGWNYYTWEGAVYKHNIPPTPKIKPEISPASDSSCNVIIKANNVAETLNMKGLEGNVWFSWNSVGDADGKLEARGNWGPGQVPDYGWKEMNLGTRLDYAFSLTCQGADGREKTSTVNVKFDGDATAATNFPYQKGSGSTINSWQWKAPSTVSFYKDVITANYWFDTKIPNALGNSLRGVTCKKDITVSDRPDGSLPPEGQYWTFCSKEGSTSIINGQRIGSYCGFNGTASVRLGKEPHFHLKNGVNGEIACNGRTMGSPIIPEEKDPNQQQGLYCQYKY